MTFERCALDGVLLITPGRFEDQRGGFVKTFHEPLFREQGIQLPIAEQFYSTSRQHVLRGMHFQAPPYDHGKLVTCLGGEILDVALDLRAWSPTFGQSVSFQLTAENAQSVWIPSGFAHGFLALSEGATVLYNVTSAHHPAADFGVRWDGFGFHWPISEPILSTRDAAFPTLAELRSPFASA